MPDDPTSKDASKDPEAKGGQDEPKAGAPADDKSKDTPSQFVTPSALQGVMDAQKRSNASEFKAMRSENAALKESIEALTSVIAKKESDKASEGDKKTKASDDTELVELRRQVSTLQEKAKDSDSRAESELRRRLDTDFENSVTAALVSAGCEEPAAAFLVIKPRLTHDPESGKVFATVKTEYGEEDLDLKTYIERHFREEVLPHVFKGKMRTGGPAGGDKGDGGSYQFTKEQAFDIKAYSKDPEKYRAAIEQGRVKGISKPGAAV